ncbi:MAG: M15 family metallopeptidase [Aeromicrobium sp.]
MLAAFDAIGWKWGGRWRSLTDLHHFSRNGR